MSKFITSILAILLTLAFSRNLLAQERQMPLTIRINPEAAVGGTTSMFVDEVEYIPLETEKNNSISNIVQLEMIPSGFVILDKGSNSITIFSSKGKQTAIIRPDFTTNHFTLDVASSTIEIYNYPRVFVYSFGGKLLRTVQQKNLPENSFGVIKYISSQAKPLFYNTSIKNIKDSLIYELLMFDRDSLKRSFFPFSSAKQIDYIDEMGLVNLWKSVNKADTTDYYIHNYDYTAYEVKEDTIQPAFKLLFPVEFSVPVDFKGLSIGEKVQYLKENKNCILRLFSFFRRGGKLFFDTGHHGYIYDLKSHRLVDIGLIKGDAISGFLPISRSEGGGGRSPVLNADEKGFYFGLPASMVHRALKVNKVAAGSASNRLNTYFNDESNRDSRPILVRVKFKNEF